MEKTVIINMQQLRHWFENNSITKVSFDTETTGLNYYYLNITGCSFCNGEAACYVDLTFQTILDEGMLEYLKDMFRTKIKKLIMHNAPFDLKVLHKAGITEVTEQIFCTQTAAHVIDECDRCGLKHLACIYLDKLEPVKYQYAAENGFHTERFWNYALNDAIWTWDLHKIFAKEIHNQGLDRMFYEVEMPFQFCLMDLGINGMLVDEKKLSEIEVEMADCIKKFETELLEMVGKKHYEQFMLFGPSLKTSPVNFNSNVQVAEYFEEAIGQKLELTKNKKDPKPKIDKFVFAEWKHIPFVYKLWQYRIALDILDKFIKPMKGFICDDCRIRCNFNNIGTRTGRLSSSKPNLQNLRKSKEALPVDCRACFIVPDGYTMLTFDYAGQELRVLGHESNDPQMLKAFNEDMDLHLMTARMMFDLPISDDQLRATHPDHDDLKEKYSEQRFKGKNGVNFPVIYGATSKRIARDNDVSEDTAQSWIDAYFNLYKGVKARLARCKSDIRNKRYVKNLIGRRRRFRHPFKKTKYGEKLDEKMVRQGFNFVVQGFSAEMLRLSMIKIRKLFREHPEWDSKFVSTVHDEVIIEIKDEFVEEAIPPITEIMKTCVKLRVPIEVDVGQGKNYSQAK